MKYAQWKGVLNNAVQMEFVYMENVFVDQIMVVKVVVNFLRQDLDQRQIYFYHRTIIIV